MPSIDEIRKHLFDLSHASFDDLALALFRYQAANNPIYHQYLELLNIKHLDVQSVAAIPFLPIQLFKTQKVVSTNAEAEAIFESSGTTEQTKSKHYVADLALYEQSIEKGLEYFFGQAAKYRFLALLPSYLERKHASLVHMADHLMQCSQYPENGFYLNDYQSLLNHLAKLEEAGHPTILLGVTFALLELADKANLNLDHTIVMETGGMKGRGPELTRMEVHEKLKSAFGLEHIHSEYGMTELLSQAYSKGNGLFQTPPWMRVQCRDINDPFEILPHGQSGMLQIMDLANIYSCSFVETSDLGKVHEDGTFEVLGRVDNSDVRGCNLMVW